jgi:hypothetical protein
MALWVGRRISPTSSAGQGRGVGSPRTKRGAGPMLKAKGGGTAPATPTGTYLTGAGYSFYSTVCPGIPHHSHRCTSDNNIIGSKQLYVRHQFALLTS